MRVGGRIAASVCAREINGTDTARASNATAAQVAVDHDDWERAIRSLQQVAHSDPNYATAGNLLIDAYEHVGHTDLALNKVEELVNAQGFETAPL